MMKNDEAIWALERALELVILEMRESFARIDGYEKSGADEWKRAMDDWRNANQIILRLVGHIKKTAAAGDTMSERLIGTRVLLESGCYVWAGATGDRNIAVELGRPADELEVVTEGKEGGKSLVVFKLSREAAAALIIVLLEQLAKGGASE